MKHSLKEACRQLRLSGLIASFELRLQEASSHQLAHEQFLELLLQDELNLRQQRRLERRKKQAKFRELKSLDQTLPDLRAGHRQFHSTKARSSSAGTSGNRQELPGSGLGLCGHQSGLCSPLHLGLRSGS